MEKIIKINENINKDKTEQTHVEKLVKMLYLFQTQRYITKEKIIRELEISKRTFYRYKKKLENIGIIIENYDDKHLTIDDGKTILRLDRIAFSNEEILSFIIASRLVENYSDLSVFGNYKSAMYKVITGLKYADKKDFVQLATKNTTLLPKTHFNIRRFPHNFLIDIQNAIAKQLSLQIEYYTYHKNEITQREIYPVEINFYRSMWHIRAFCLLKNDYREFRLDRIQKLETTNNQFDKNEFTIEKYLASKKISTPEQQVTIHFSENIERLIHSGKYNFKIIKERKLEKKIEIVFSIDKYKKDEFFRWLLIWGRNCEIIKPKSFLKEIKQVVKELCDYYL